MRKTTLSMMAALMLCAATMGCEGASKYVDFEKGHCVGKWHTVSFEVRADTAKVVAVCVR
jgi:hypothetical protein